jgi:hypothetical protein
MRICACPVLRAPGQKPVYYLVLGTRNSLGIWHFGDAAARAEVKWWETLDARETARDEADGLGALFSVPSLLRPDIKEVEADALPVITENIARLAEEHGEVRVGDYPAEVFGEYLGLVRETVVRAAVKNLHASGRTPSDGKGPRIADLKVSRPSR